MKNKKLIAILTLLCFMFTLMPAAAFAEGDEDVSEPTITTWENCISCSADNPHMISTAAELDNIRTHVSEDKITGYFKLANDIVFKDADFVEGGAFYNGDIQWNPIGRNVEKTGTNGDEITDHNAFCGVFDGAGFKISNLKMADPTNKKLYYSGLFAILGDKGTIKNVTFENCISKVSHKAGIVVGSVESESAKLENITLKSCTVQPTNGTSGGAAPALVAWKLMGTVNNVQLEGCKHITTAGSYMATIAKKIENVSITDMLIKDYYFDVNNYPAILFNEISGTKNTIKNLSVKTSEFDLRHYDHFPLIWSAAVGSKLSMENVALEMQYKDTASGADALGEANHAFHSNLEVTMQNCSIVYKAEAVDLTSVWLGSNEYKYKGEAPRVTYKDNEGTVLLDAYAAGNVYYTNAYDSTKLDLQKFNKFTLADLNGGTVAVQNPTYDTFVTPKKDGYIFDGWYDNASYEGEAKTTPEAGNIYYAKWTKSNYSVTPSSIAFEPVTFGYEQSTVQTVEVVLNAQPVAAKSVASSASFDAAIDGTSVKITPKTGLAVGTYNETIVVTTEDTATHNVAVSVQVNKKVIVPDEPNDDDNTPPSSSSGGFSGSYNYPVNAGTVEGATVTFSKTNAVAGDVVTITVTPDNGYGVAEVIVTDEDGNVIPVTYLGNGEYSFVMPAGKVNIETVCKPAITLTIGDKKANVFGKIVINDVAPIIVDGRTMLPIRFVAEALGADVSWNEDTQTVTITKDGTVVEIIIGADYAYINGERVELDSPAFIANSRTYLPVRFVSEALGADVNWDAVTQQVVIMK